MRMTDDICTALARLRLACVNTRRRRRTRRRHSTAVTASLVNRSSNARTAFTVTTHLPHSTTSHRLYYSYHRSAVLLSAPSHSCCIASITMFPLPHCLLGGLLAPLLPSRPSVLPLLHLLFALLLTLSPPPPPVAGFKPTGDAGHAGIVAQALKAVTTTDTLGHTYRFTPSQIAAVQQGVIDADLSTHFLDEDYHCDNEDLDGCSSRILTERLRLKQALATAASQAYDIVPQSCKMVQSDFGQLLHTLQDFYAHSN